MRHPALAQLPHHRRFACVGELFGPLPIDSQFVTARWEWRIDQFKVNLLAGVVIYAREGVMDIRLGHE
jgi:hypothetical protein